MAWASATYTGCWNQAVESSSTKLVPEFLLHWMYTRGLHRVIDGSGASRQTGPMEIVPAERIASRICVIRERKVMIDADLAALYGVPTKQLNQAVRRNPRRFPEDFMFQLVPEEDEALKVTFCDLKRAATRTRRPTPSTVCLHRTGVAMLSSMLKSDPASDVNVAIMRTFVRLRQTRASNEELARRIDQHDREITVLFESVQNMVAPASPPGAKRQIGFAQPRD